MHKIKISCKINKGTKLFEQRKPYMRERERLMAVPNPVSLCPGLM
jgi:hypothetical protein